MAGVYLVPNVNSVIKARAALMLSSVLAIATHTITTSKEASSFRMVDADTATKVERAAIDMLWCTQNQSMQSFGVQIGSILSKTKDMDHNMHQSLMFTNMVRAL